MARTCPSWRRTWPSLFLYRCFSLLKFLPGHQLKASTGRVCGHQHWVALTSLSCSLQGNQTPRNVQVPPSPAGGGRRVICPHPLHLLSLWEEALSPRPVQVQETLKTIVLQVSWKTNSQPASCWSGLGWGGVGTELSKRALLLSIAVWDFDFKRRLLWTHSTGDPGV